jgi:hypothetical protein
MAAITLRTVKGSPLSNQEMDDNFNNINVQLNAALPAANYTAADVLAKLITVDGVGSGVDADTLDGYNSAVAATGNTVVVRNSSGDINAGTVNATTVIANLTGNVTGNVTGTLNGNATNVSGTVAIVNGGTGGSSATAARSNLGLGTIATQNANAVAITGGTIAGLGTALAIADGGTGSTSKEQARINLGVALGSDVQPFSNELTGIAAATNTGIYVRVGAANVVQRSIVTAGNGVVITNGNGSAGNISVDLPSSSSPVLTGLTLSGTASIATLAVSGNGTITGNLSVAAGVTTMNSTGINTSNINASGYITAVGNITGYYSDDRLKTKLGKIENALDKLCSLEGFYFEANQTAQDLGYSVKKEVGVSAQSTQAVLPEVVHPAPIGHDYLTVDYARMMPLVIEAIKELRAEIQALK